MKECADKQGVEHRHHGCFGGGEDAAIDAAQNNHRH